MLAQHLVVSQAGWVSRNKLLAFEAEIVDDEVRL